MPADYGKCNLLFDRDEYLYPVWYLGLLLLQRTLQEQTSDVSHENKDGRVVPRSNLETKRTATQQAFTAAVVAPAVGIDGAQQQGVLNRHLYADCKLASALYDKSIVDSLCDAMKPTRELTDRAKRESAKGAGKLATGWMVECWEPLIKVCARHLKAPIDLAPAEGGQVNVSAFKQALSDRLDSYNSSSSKDMKGELESIFFEHLSGESLLLNEQASSATAEHVLRDISLSDVNITWLYAVLVTILMYLGFDGRYNRCIRDAKDALITPDTVGITTDQKPACKDVVVKQYTEAANNDCIKRSAKHAALQRRETALSFFAIAKPQTSQESESSSQDQLAPVPSGSQQPVA